MGLGKPSEQGGSMMQGHLGGDGPSEQGDPGGFRLSAPSPACSRFTCL